MSVQPATRRLHVREKLLKCGAERLSDMELLAVFISSGSGKRSSLQLAHDLLKHLGDMREVLNADLSTFAEVQGLGLVRYVQLQAAREICRRSDFIGLKRETQLLDAHQTYAFLKRQLRDKKNEVFAALFLDSQHRVLAYEELFTGTINTAAIHSRPIIERTLKLNAAALILAHNHPSGLSDASHHDVELTERIRQALDLIDTRLLDHLVIGDNEVYSIMSTMKWNCN